MARAKHMERTLKAIRKQDDEFAAEFYRRLLQRRPDLEPLFADVSMAEQANNLLASIILIVESQRQTDHLEHYFRKLGQSHAGMGLKNEHYEAWRAVMLDTMADFCGVEWDDEANRAWRDTFAEAAEVMLAASEASAPTPQPSANTR